MANVTVYRPGPSSVEEYSTLEGLRNAISTNVYGRVGGDTGLGLGEVGTAPWWPAAWTYTAGGMPSLSFRWATTAGDNLTLIFRYSSALVGLGDPATFYPAVFNGFYSAVYADVRHAKGRTAALLGLTSMMGSSGIFRSAFTSLTTRDLLYSTSSSRALGYYGVRFQGHYTPNAAEFADGLRQLEVSATLVCQDADEGTINMIDGLVGLGTAVDQVPHVISQPGTQTAAWDDLSEGLAPLAEQWDVRTDPAQVDEWYQQIFDGWEAEEEAKSLDRPSSVTHPDDQALDLYTPSVAIPPAAAFAAPGAVTALVAVPAAILTISKPAVLKVVGAAAAGAAAASAYTSGFYVTMADMARAITTDLVGSVVDGISYLTGVGNPLARIADAVESGGGGGGGTLPEDVAADIKRIAVALETISSELTGTAEPPHDGILRATELASQTRSEITLRAHGQLITCATGSVEEE